MNLPGTQVHQGLRRPITNDLDAIVLRNGAGVVVLLVTSPPPWGGRPGPGAARAPPSTSHAARVIIHSAGAFPSPSSAPTHSPFLTLARGPHSSRFVVFARTVSLGPVRRGPPAATYPLLAPPASVLTPKG